jgi:general secretion pathway protein F
MEFRYKAARQSGEVVEGCLQAADRDTALARLLDMGLVPIRADVSSGLSLRALLNADLADIAGRGVDDRQIMFATRELATLLGAGVELERALEILAELAERPAMAELFAALLADVRGGLSLSDALAQHGRQFPPSYASMVRAGEAGGALEAVFERIADYLERAHADREALRSALVYPVILLAMAVIAVAVMVGVVLPQFEPLFVNAGVELPWLTRAMLAISDAAADYGLIAMLVIVVGVVGLRLHLHQPGPRLAWDRWLLSLPLIGPLALKSNVARLARTLATLLQNGVATVPALAIVTETLGNRYLAEGLRRASEQVKSGARMSDALAGVDRFPALAIHLARIGEETGRLEAMLEHAAMIFEQDARRVSQRLLAALLPALTALIGLFIAAIIASIFLAIVSVNQLAF